VIRPLVLLPEAEGEIVAALEWYEQRRPGLGVDFLADLEIAIRDIWEHPEAWPVWRPKFPFRKRVMARFPYVIMYRITDEQIRVVAVAHAKRRPGYWAERR
jgi:toxin ParE1/3/4